MTWSRAFLSVRFVKFLVAGGLGALANILSRLGFSEVLPYAGAVTAAYLTGMTVAYALNRIVVFGAGDRSLRGEVLVFALVNLVAVAQTLGISLLLAFVVLPGLGIVAHVETIAHVIGVIVPVFTSFLGHKHWTFRNHQ